MISQKQVYVHAVLMVENENSHKILRLYEEEKNVARVLGKRFCQIGTIQSYENCFLLYLL